MVGFVQQADGGRAFKAICTDGGARDLLDIKDAHLHVIVVVGQRRAANELGQGGVGAEHLKFKGIYLEGS